MRLRLLLLLALSAICGAVAPEYFVPTERLQGIGVERDDLSSELLAVREDQLIQSQTFSIMRDPQAVPGARRITEDRKLQSLFRTASERSGLPATLLEAVAYLAH